ncbi:pelargonidin 3-o-(6-caffeoylglucoside) 5-o-(6-o-malonylglucoside) 4'''-malonyltransferase [Phtheirospermum japonicum]|uniref:Pelargonidin 3-o-(6-caffeoylglucoside) 5-o-(6-o-malonylglucoside) 4'''-malonyltransferase n=1 Tax=Phtheirospermum japonicum TaxID=374723 RepID=A0A830BC56_9LAMI|nr:pelargonidin 3-o-(6-caffeoylglucoside) 5-o-(6-o-malonylglucoside) 4'''-malonyltransferase [Phtheirospermum japonicum]
MKKDHLVECNDEGAEFVVAEANDIELMDFIAKTESHDQLYSLLSRQPYDVDKPNDPLLSIQITKFKCGGLSISISLSHRISDGSSLGTLISAWSNAQNNKNPELIIPSFNSPSFFPGTNLECDFEPPHSVAVKRLLFNKEAISSLKSKLRPSKNGKGYLSRVRVVSAVIAKALIGVELAKNEKSRACFIGQGVNMRSRTIPPLPKHLNGNLVVEAVAQCMAANDTKEKGLQELVYLLGDVIEKTIDDCEKLLSLDEDGRKKILRDPLLKMFETLASGDGIAVWFTDWSKFGFYEADFGSGHKPVWVRVGTVCAENLTILVENREGDGIEAWVHLDPKDVTYFERDEDMKLFIIA